MPKKLFDDEDYYLDGGFTVMTEEYHLKRGFCCGSGCKWCPYWPKAERGNIQLKKDLENLEKDLVE
jgi:hypothetical protein